MKNPESHCARSLRGLLLLAFLTGLPGGALAQAVASPPPLNSHTKSYGAGWECDYSFREAAGACAADHDPCRRTFGGYQFWTWLGLQSRLSRGRRDLRSHTRPHKRPFNRVDLRTQWLGVRPLLS